MKTFLEKFYEKITTEKSFDCIDFEYDGIEYQVSEGHFICYREILMNLSKKDLIITE